MNNSITTEVWHGSLLGQLVLNNYFEEMFLFTHCSIITIYHCCNNVDSNFLYENDDGRGNHKEKLHIGFTPFKF